VADLIDVDIEKVASSGEGLGRWNGKRVFVPLCLPGERVRARLSGPSGDFAKAGLVEVLSASPERRTAPCPRYAECGGCSLQHASIAAQLEIKRGILAEAFSRIGKIGMDPAAVDILHGAEFACRNRFQFHGGKTGPGLMSRSGAAHVPLSSCPVASGEVNLFLSQESAPASVPPGSRRVVFGSAAGLFVEGRDEEAYARVCGSRLRFSCPGFFQSNLEMLELLVERLSAFLPGGEGLADLYGGVGTFSAFLGGAYGRVSLVEENPASAACAESNLSASGARLDIQAMPVEEWIGLAASKRRFDAIVCDPPRTGLSASVRRYLALSGAPRIAYVSCDPATLARDLGFLLKEGYDMESFAAFDFYPQTAHIESLALLARKARP
jgi:23S rRNA (uracil1939-C5)-methyltransferase